jgi:L,D-transpeptidase YbiS
MRNVCSTPKRANTGKPIANRRSNTERLPFGVLWACRRWDVRLTKFVLIASLAKQRLWLFERHQSWAAAGRAPASGGALGLFHVHGREYQFRRCFLASTSRFGAGQQSGSNRTPLGLHRIAEKIGAGQPIGTVFESRQPVGLTWQGRPDAAIAHRILWLEGLETGFNQGGNSDSHSRYIYIHGLGNEPSLGQRSSRGCIHLAAADLLPLFDRVPMGTLVWIG